MAIMGASMLVTGSKLRIPRPQLEWLREQSARWRAEGLLADEARAAILDGYEIEPPPRRGLQALVAIGILVCAVGVLLLIGYNWSLVPPVMRVSLVLVALASAFIASAFTYRAGRRALGEALAFAGMLLYANGIWLIAQALNIQGHFPDAFFWAAVGALVVAGLVRSPWNGMAGAALLLIWGFAEGVATPGNNYLFLAAWPLAVWLARRLDSPVMLALTALAGVVWVAVIDNGEAGGALLPAAIVLAGCALYAAGGFESRRLSLSFAWQGAGLLTLLVVFVPLMIVGAQADLLRQLDRAPLPLVMTAAVLGALALSGLVRARTAADWAISGVAIATCAWAGLAMLGMRSAVAGTVLFSLAALAVGVGYVRLALASGSLFHLTAGVLFALLFLLVRWISVVGNLFWSGLLLLAAGGGLLLLARLWRARERDATTAHGGVA
jgi:uncharacterized membrane protein